MPLMFFMHTPSTDLIDRVVHPTGFLLNTGLATALIYLLLKKTIKAPSK